MTRLVGACLAALMLVLLSPPADAKNPWEELMGPGKPRMWADPQGRFYLDLPVGWKAVPRKDEPVVDFWKQNVDNGFVVHATVLMRPVPPKVSVRHYALKVEQETKQSAPRYQRVSKEKTTMSGVPARKTRFIYMERGHANLVNEAEQHVFIIGERAFVVTFEMARGVYPAFEEDIEKMVKGFVGRRPGDENLATPKARKRIKSGEMVNPNAVRY